MNFSRYRQIVIAGTGNGTIHHLLQNALLKAQSLGIAIVISSRCAVGQVLPVPGQPFVDSKGLTPVETRIALILELGIMSKTRVEKLA